MKSITIRGIDTQLNQALKTQASKDNKSVNQWVLQALRKITGMDKEPLFKKHNDLDSLAGGWDEKETRTFDQNTRIFEEIDEDIWR